MKRFIFLAFICSGLVHAQVLKLSIKDFNFNYDAPFGEGTASSFSRNQTEFTDGLNGVEVKVEKANNAFNIRVSGSENQEFSFKNAPDFMLKAQTMELQGLNLSLATGLDFKLTSGSFENTKSNLVLKSLEVFCERSIAFSTVRDQLIQGCIQKLNLRSSRFLSEKLGKIISKALKVSTNSLGINNVNLQVLGGRMDLTAEIKSDLNGKIRARGEITYNPNLKVVSIKLDEVKFGVLNITSRVFDEIKKRENESLRVNRPFINYTLK